MGTPSYRSWFVGILAAGLLLGVAWAEESIADEEGVRKQVLALNDVTGAEPMRGKLKEMLDDKLGTKKLLTVALKMAKEKPQPLNRNSTFLLALAAESAKEVDTSAAFYRLNAQQALKLYSEQGLATAYVGLIQLYTENKRFAESEKVCKEFLAIEGEEDDAIEKLKPGVLRNMVMAVARQGAVDRAVKMVDEMIKADPRYFPHRVLKAIVLREGEKYDEAVKVYLDVIERVKKDGRLEKEDQDDLILDYRYALSGLYIDLNDVAKAAEQLKILLEREPANPTYNNDLGYIWADRGMNLPEAEKMIRKAIEEERKLKKKMKVDGDEDNPAYLDSLGWVLFKQGKAKEAKEQLLLAVKQKEGQHTEILDHLGDVQLALGEKDAAVATWKKAVQSATQSKRDQKKKVEVEKKLKSHEEK